MVVAVRQAFAQLSVLSDLAPEARVDLAFDLVGPDGPQDIADKSGLLAAFVTRRIGERPLVGPHNRHAKLWNVHALAKPATPNRSLIRPRISSLAFLLKARTITRAGSIRNWLQSMATFMAIAVVLPGKRCFRGTCPRVI